MQSVKECVELLPFSPGVQQSVGCGSGALIADDTPVCGPAQEAKLNHHQNLVMTMISNLWLDFAHLGEGVKSC